MRKSLRILSIEDSEQDFELLRRHLERAGYDLVMNRVDSPEAMKAKLQAQQWDVILADYSMPRFSGLAALSVLKDTGLDIPFIIISGTIGEEIAVNAMLAGADDYLMKDDLRRLAPAIERELDEARNRLARRKAEESLKDSEAELRALFSAMTDLTLVLDADGRCVRIAPNKAFASQPDLAKMLGRTAHEIYDKETADFFLDHVRRTLQERRAHTVEYSISKGENVLWLEGSISPMSERSVVWIARDITERKRAEEALRESEERYRLLFESNPDPTYVFDLQTLRFVAVNEAMVQLYGYSRYELRSMTIKDIWPPQEIPPQLERLAKWQSKTARDTEWKHRKKDGSTIDVEITFHPLIFAGRLTYVVQAQDVTTKKLLEAQLRQSQRMEAIGQLAGGIAHDFNNLLTIINGYSDLTLDQLNPGSPLRKNIEEIQKAGSRAAALTGQLLAFSRKQVLQPTLLQLNSVITELEKMLRRLIGEDVELRTMLAPGLGIVKADQGQIEQVIMNLAINARDAMPRGGKLTITTANAELDEHYSQKRIGVVPGSYVRLSVTDTGVGMEPQTEARIFEPFFTTKQPGRGTGLGLSTVYGIVNQSGGHISVDSELGAGTSFDIYLPRTGEPVKTQKPTHPSREALKGNETVLLAEDDETVRILAGRILEKYGYRVLEAVDGSAAIRICRRYPGPIHLLITDVVMPEMNGLELFGRLSELRDDLKVLYISGYTDSAVAPFVQKPFTPESLAIAAREVLGSI